MARFIVDAQLPPALAERLRQHGHDADHVNRIGLGGARDTAIWRHVERTGSALLTKDADFLHLARMSQSGSSVVWIRLGNATNDVLWSIIEPILPEIIAAMETGERVIEVR